MVTREERRALIIPNVARLVRSRDFRTSFARVTGEPNRQTIIVALPDDSMGYVFDRLRDADNVAALAMFDGAACKIAVMWPASQARLAVAKEDDSMSPIHEDSRVDMFFDYLLCVRTAVVQRVAAQLVDHGELLLA